MHSRISHIITYSIFFIGTISAGQNSPERAILNRASDHIKKAEPSWQFHGSVCTVPPLIDEQMGVACGWYQMDDSRSEIFANVMIWRISNSEAASRWIKLRKGLKVENWKIINYKLGDEALLITTKNITHYSLAFRKGCFLAEVEGKPKEKIELISRYLFDQMKAEPFHCTGRATSAHR
jgi:hypothetical protein